MHHRRIATFLIGLWVAGSLLLAYVAVQNVLGVDEIIRNATPAARKILSKLGPDGRALLRYYGIEQSRGLIALWELFEIAIGLTLAAVLYLGTHVNRLMVWTCCMMVVIVLFLHFGILPEMDYLGRQLDFDPTGGTRRLWGLYGLYAGLSALKLALAAVLTGYLFLFKTRVRAKQPEPAGKLFSTAERSSSG